MTDEATSFAFGEALTEQATLIDPMYNSNLQSFRQRQGQPLQRNWGFHKPAGMVVHGREQITAYINNYRRQMQATVVEIVDIPGVVVWSEAKQQKAQASWFSEKAQAVVVYRKKLTISTDADCMDHLEADELPSIEHHLEVEVTFKTQTALITELKHR